VGRGVRGFEMTNPIVWKWLVLLGAGSSLARVVDVEPEWFIECIS
jgi:hypothetical protein